MASDVVTTLGLAAPSPRRVEATRETLSVVSASDCRYKVDPVACFNGFVATHREIPGVFGGSIDNARLVLAAPEVAKIKSLRAFNQYMRDHQLVAPRHNNAFADERAELAQRAYANANRQLNLRPEVVSALAYIRKERGEHATARSALDYFETHKLLERVDRALPDDTVAAAGRAHELRTFASRLTGSRISELMGLASRIPKDDPDGAVAIRIARDNGLDEDETALVTAWSKLDFQLSDADRDFLVVTRNQDRLAFSVALAARLAGDDWMTRAPRQNVMMLQREVVQALLR